MTNPTGVDEKDSLKDFHRVLAEQATSQQITEFQALLKDAESAKAILENLAQQQSHGGSGTEAPVTVAEVNRSLQQLRADNQKFVEGFSAVQKSGLKEILKKLGEADSNLDENAKRRDASLQATSRGSAEVESRCKSVIQSVTDVSNHELGLGKRNGHRVGPRHRPDVPTRRGAGARKYREADDDRHGFSHACRSLHQERSARSSS